jgi:hypothetical protein
MTLDDLLPAPDWAERHSRGIAAPPPVVLTAAREVTVVEMRLAAVLLALRGLGRPPPIPFTTALEKGVGGTWLESAESGDVWAGVLRPWRNQSHPIADRDALLAFDEPGWVKVAMDLTATPRGAGTLLSTETRITATSDDARRIFGRYWLVVRPGSGLVRHSLLRAVERRALKSVTVGSP